MKKVIIVFILLTSTIFADYIFYVETPEMVDAYYNVFSAMKAIFGSDSYLEILKLFFLVGGFFTLAEGVFRGFGRNMNGVIGGYAKYTLIGTALLVLLFSSTTKIIIMAENNDVYCTSASTSPGFAEVDGFPSILGAGFNFINKLGVSMLDIVEDEYIGPSDTLSMRKGGYNHSIRDAMGVLNFRLSMDENNSVPDLSLSVRSFIAQCITIPFSSKGTQGTNKLAAIKASPNIFEYFEDLYRNVNPKIGGINARDYTMNFNGNIYTCGDFYDKIRSGLLDFKNHSTCFSEIDEGAVSLIVGGGTMPPMSTFENINLQAGLISELEGSLTDLGLGVSGIGYATGKSRAEAVQTYLGQGEYMAGILPVLQMTLRAIIFAFFPFVFIMALLPGGLSILKNYMLSLIWIELWTPVAGILNMFLNENVKNSVGSIYGGSGMTLLSSIDMLSTTATISSIAGYLYAFVPGISWAIISGTSYMLESMGRDMASFMQKNIQTDSMNMDQRTIARNRESNARSGKDLSMAEMQHYEAIQGGRMEGAKLAVQMKAGIDTMADIETMEETRNVEGYKLLESSLGGGAAGIGAALAANDARDNATKVETGRRVSNGQTLGESTIGAAENNANIEAGSDISKNKNKVTMNEAEGAQNVKQAEIKSDGKVGNSNSVNTMIKAKTNKKQFDINEALATDPNLGGLAGKNKMLGIVQDNETWKSRATKFGKDFQKKLANAKTENEWKDILEAKERAEYGKKHNMTNEEILDGAAKKIVQKQVTDGAEAKKTEELGTDLNNLGTKNASNMYKDLMATNVYYHNDYSKDNIDKLANDEGLNNVFNLNRDTANRKKLGGLDYESTVDAGTKAGEIAGQTTLDTGAGQEGENKVYARYNNKNSTNYSREFMKYANAISKSKFSYIQGDRTISNDFILDYKNDSVSIARIKSSILGRVSSENILRMLIVDAITGTKSGTEMTIEEENKRIAVQEMMDINEEKRKILMDIAGLKSGTAAIVAAHYTKKAIVALIGDKEKLLNKLALNQDKMTAQEIRAINKKIAEIDAQLEEAYKRQGIDTENKREKYNSDPRKMTKKEKEIYDRQKKADSKTLESKRNELKREIKYEEEKVKRTNNKIKEVNKEINQVLSEAKKEIAKKDSEIKELEKLNRKEQRELDSLRKGSGRHSKGRKALDRIKELENSILEREKKISDIREEKIKITENRDSTVKKKKDFIKKMESTKTKRLTELSNNLRDINDILKGRISQDILQTKGATIKTFKDSLRETNIRNIEILKEKIADIEKINQSSLSKLSNKKVVKELKKQLKQLEEIEEKLKKAKEELNLEKKKDRDALSAEKKKVYDGLENAYKSMIKANGDKESIKQLKRDMDKLLEIGFKSRVGSDFIAENNKRYNLSKTISNLNTERNKHLKHTNKTFETYREKTLKKYNSVYDTIKTNNERVRKDINRDAEKEAKKYIKKEFKLKDAELEAASDKLKQEKESLFSLRDKKIEAESKLREMKASPKTVLDSKEYLNAKEIVDKLRSEYDEKLKDINLKQIALDKSKLEIEALKKEVREKLIKGYKESELSRIGRKGYKKITGAFGEYVFKKDGFVAKNIKKMRKKDIFSGIDLSQKELSILTQEEVDNYLKRQGSKYLKVTNTLTKVLSKSAGFPAKAGITLAMLEASNAIETNNTLWKIFEGTINTGMAVVGDVLGAGIVSYRNENAFDFIEEKERNLNIAKVEIEKEIKELKDLIYSNNFSDEEIISMKIGIGDLREQIETIQAAEEALNIRRTILTQEKEKINHGIFSGTKKEYEKAVSEIKDSDISDSIHLSGKRMIVAQAYDGIRFLQTKVSKEDWEKAKDMLISIGKKDLSVEEISYNVKKIIEDLTRKAIKNDLIQLAKQKEEIIEFNKTISEDSPDTKKSIDGPIIINMDR